MFITTTIVLNVDNYVVQLAVCTTFCLTTHRSNGI